ncbi:MAG: MerR family transcriptional regulator [Lachnospiraceae bacterium]|nr:MerR family transcriptional regulator [Lachnospiraceae bacterium]
MSDIRYMISDASKLVDVEAHVLRYWEEELELSISRNEMGHRYYTEEDIRLFKHIKELKEQGVQLKAIKSILPELGKGDLQISGLVARMDRSALVQGTDPEEKMLQFQTIMSRLISEALEDNTEQLGKEISVQVSDHVIKEMDYLMRVREEREDERFKKLDESIRNSQRARKQMALFKQEEEKKKVGFFRQKKRQTV